MAKATVAVPNKNAKSPADSSSALHPPYFQMISEAISTLKERTGSSQPAIAKLIDDKYKAALPPNFKKILSVQLKKLVNSDKLVKVKNSYKISSTEKLKQAFNEKTKAKGAAAEKGLTRKKASEKGGVKTKRLSQVKTPEALKRKEKKKDPRTARSAGQVENPDGLKKTKNLTP